MDQDAMMLDKIGNTLTQLQIKYRSANSADRAQIKPTLNKLLQEYQAYQFELIEEGIISTEGDLIEMEKIRQEISNIADTQQLIASLVKVLAFIGTKI